MNFRNISSWCIQNPVPPIVLFIGLLLAGLFAFMNMDVNNNPDIDFPAVEVGISQPGAVPTEIENQITQKVEAAIRGVNGVDEINSSIREGFSSTFVQFEIGTPTDQGVNDVRNALSQIRSDLPEGILEPQVTRVDIAGEPITFVAAETTDMSLEELSWYVDNTVSRRLLGVEGVAAVAREGGVERNIRVILDPAALQAQGISAAQVNAQIRQTNLNAGGGRAEIAGSEQAVRVLGNAPDAYALSQMQIAVPGGRVVRLADLGEVKDAYSEQRSIARMNGRQVISFNVSRSKGSSEVTVYDAVWQEMKKLEKEDPRIRFVEINNSVDYTKGQYDSAMHGLIEGAILAVLVVFLFLRDFRATMISAIAIPLSAIPAFYFMDLMGITLNGLSLLALSLVAGVLVDDAIVEIENIVRHMRMGKTAYQAAMDAADEIGLAVVATTMSIVAVFLPVALMPGISGQFFQSFGYTVVIAVLMSLFVARMITPLIAAYFLKAHGVQAHASGPAMDKYLGILKWSLDTSKADAARALIPDHRGRWYHYILGGLMVAIRAVAFVAGVGISMQLLGKAGILPSGLNMLLALIGGVVAFIVVGKLLGLVMGMFSTPFADFYKHWGQRWAARKQDHRITMVGVGFGAFALQIALFMGLSMSFQPPLNLDFSRVRIGMAPGSTVQQASDLANRTAEIFEGHPDVDRVFQRVFTGAAFLNIVLKKDREMTSTEFERSLAPKLAQIPDAQVNFMSQGGGGPGSGGRDMVLYLGSPDPVLLQQTANKIADEMESLPQLVAPRVVGDLVRPEIIVKPRFDLAADLGVTTTALSQTIRIATLGDIAQNSAKFSLSDRQVPITVSLSEESRRDLSILENLPVPTSSGGSVPLKAVAEIGFGAGPSAVQRTNQVRRIAVGADLSPGLVSGDVWPKINELPTVKNLPEGVQKLELGDSKWQAELLFYFFVALAAGVMLVFAVLVLLYRRFLSPFVNMGSLLLAPLGAAIGLHIAGQPLSLPVFIGILMLFGIVAKNSILLIDFAVEMMDHGMEKDEAIYEAGHKRAQPIVMTTVAMVAGMIPIALSLTGDGSWRAPMGVTVIGGLLLSTLLTLLLVPAYFSIAVDIEKWVGARFRKLIDNGEEHAPMAGPVPAE
ncbi:efflux RND transporter permease subunit [Sphingomonas sp. HDW15A]|uniref:efflux RND transporter permease subunit n=1 Tax=Sphingomonas sp. HDW15A TaxID=2714942 RepID=UPI00140E2954|nr:efflux RND transporter permease subunit [Sphingomonas sp. HDW15A]QIK95264.1 efflux RND transporter permease subunit [Sphingomonas sp. HDW15A]